MKLADLISSFPNQRLRWDSLPLALLSLALTPLLFTSIYVSVRSLRIDTREMAAMFLAYIPPPAYNPWLRTPQGKVAELRLELNSGGKKDKNYSGKKIALKKIVANMTMSNNDMVALFPDIIGCMHIQSLEIKKM